MYTLEYITVLKTTVRLTLNYIYTAYRRFYYVTFCLHRPAFVLHSVARFSFKILKSLNRNVISPGEGSLVLLLAMKGLRESRNSVVKTICQ